MRRDRTVVARIVAVAGVLLVAAGCYPVSETPTTQPVPPGGRVIATGPALTETSILQTTRDLSTILFMRARVEGVEVRSVYRFFVYDDDTRTTIEVPVGRAEGGQAVLAPDARSVVFTSNDPQLQVGPAAVNCVEHRPWLPDTYHVCDELYLFDLETRETRQLTGLDGSSPYSNVGPVFADDGQSIEFITGFGRVDTSGGYHRLDLATGQIEDVPRPPFTPPATSWDRGDHTVAWSSGTLTSVDHATGDVTTLWADESNYSLRSVAGNGRFIVLSNWVNNFRNEIFRLIDTDTGSIRVVSTPWISDDGSRYAVVQPNVAPTGEDRLVLAPLPT